MRTVPFDLPATTFSTFRAPLSNSSAVASSLMTVINHALIGGHLDFGRREPVILDGQHIVIGTSSGCPGGHQPPR